MDPLSSLLNGLRAEGSVASHAVLRAPWTLRFADRAPLTMVTVLHGGGTLILADGTEHVVRQGDTAVVRGPSPFHLADSPASLTGPHEAYEISCFVDDPDCTARHLDGIHWGAAPEDTTALIVAAYRTSGHRPDRLLRALPPILTVTDDPEICDWLESTATDATTRTPGSQALMDRLLDWALVCTLRTWFAGPEAPDWIRTLTDPVVGPALKAIHAHPSSPWTVASLAAHAGVSRALFAKRFTALMNQPPLTYLTELRMEEATALLLDTDMTIAQIARAVGYADPFGFSAAFKRWKGHSPSAFRLTA
ncbi:AraC family transcriptional regulator [Nocardia sp. NPDC004068]|uniref:AraC family transcriptional regulator n=1 Tax=Nocardia sp. NPDC004068 TaxID=3364303 RepID=UPI0036D0F2E9